MSIAGPLAPLRLLDRASGLDAARNHLGAGGGTERAHELDARSLRGLLGVVLHPRLGSVWERGTGLARYRGTGVLGFSEVVRWYNDKPNPNGVSAPARP